MPRPSPTLSAILVVGIALFADTLIYFLLVPLLPGYAQQHHLGPLGVGLLVWSYSAALLGSTLPLSRILEGRGRRTPMLAGLGLLGLTTLLFAFTHSYPLLVVARILQGISATLTWVAGLALLADTVPTEQRGKAMGSVFAFANAGLLLGPPLSGWLVQTWGPRAPFLLAAALVVLDAVARMALLQDPPPRPGVPLGLRDLMQDRAVRTLAGMMALGAAMTTLLEGTLPIHFDQSLRLGPAAIGLLFGLMAGTHMLTSPLMGILSDRVGRRPLLTAGLMTGAILVPATVLAPSLPVLVGVMVALGLAVSLLLSPVSPALADAVEARGSSSYASVFGILNISYALGMLVGPLLGSVLTAALGLKGAMVLLALGFLAFLPNLRHLKGLPVPAPEA